MTPPVIVLAGGASSRFGSNKLAASLAGSPVLDHALAVVAAIADLAVVVIGPDDPDPMLPANLAVTVTLARDAVAHQGPLAGLAAGLARLAALAPAGDASGDEVVLVVAGDMPTPVAEVLRLLGVTLAAESSLGIACLETDPVSLLPAAVRPGLVGPAATALLADDRRSLRALLAVVPSVSVPATTWRTLDPAADTLRDIDTPADLEGG